MGIQHGNVTDSLSAYQNNNAYLGAGVTIIKGSVYIGTGIIFDDNEAKT